MSSDDSRGLEYVRGVYEDSQRFALSLLKENERLRQQNAELSHELSVRTAVLNARTKPSAPEGDADAIAARLAAIQKENERLCAEHAALQQQSASLLNLYVATYQLHGTLDRAEVVSTLKEIVANMIGSEHLGIFELEPTGERLTLIASQGIDPLRYKTVEIDSGAIGAAARTGEIYLGGKVRPGMGAEEPVVACVPMTVGAKIHGVIAIFELLGQKAGLDSDDLELFNLLKIHAGMALYCTGLHARSDGAR
jgi:hypothetical protein